MAIDKRAASAVEGIGPVKDPAQIKDAIKKGLDIVKAGGICVIDMRVKPGYDSNMSGAPAAAHKR